jgi:hypothetical protein
MLENVETWFSHIEQSDSLANDERGVTRGRRWGGGVEGSGVPRRSGKWRKYYPHNM